MLYDRFPHWLPPPTGTMEKAHTESVSVSSVLLPCVGGEMVNILGCWNLAALGWNWGGGLVQFVDNY